MSRFNTLVLSVLCLLLGACDQHKVSYSDGIKQAVSDGGNEPQAPEPPTPAEPEVQKFSFEMDTQESYESWHLSGVRKTKKGWQLSRLPIAESGTLVLDDTIDAGVFARVKPKQKFDDPVVLAFVKSREGNDPVEARARHVSDEFQIFMQEPGRGSHNPEEISYLIFEKGRHVLSPDITIQAGEVQTSKVHREGEAYNDAEWVDFHRDFREAPVVLSSLNSYNNANFMASHSFDATKEGFSILQEAAGTGSVAVEESIAWVAANEGQGRFHSVDYEIGRGHDGINNGVGDATPYLVDLIDFLIPPDLVVGLQTALGTDGAWVRAAASNQDPWNFLVYAEEDLVGDAEQEHTDEVFGWMAFESGARLWAYAPQAVIQTPPLSIVGVEKLRDSKVKWQFSQDTSKADFYHRAYVRVSRDAGQSWTGWIVLQNDQPLPELIAGESLQDVRLRFYVYARSAHRAYTPVLKDFVAEVW